MNYIRFQSLLPNNILWLDVLVCGFSVSSVTKNSFDRYPHCCTSSIYTYYYTDYMNVLYHQQLMISSCGQAMEPTIKDLDIIRTLQRSLLHYLIHS